ncbi:RNA polymerase sigma factor [Azospirillum sp.]|uniref:RNA polymerase sigma factor n=1 Tax=Azospirillum sp. TaxID=34012 RepID=UPI002D6C1167|nr:RNA polymerase sigma factor [Azospirillum sp.]HYF89000.1 RNA polymerase sigma factor [Azospirillum sp.]
MDATFEADLIDLLPQLRPIARRFARSADDAADLLQDTLVRCLENRDRFEPGTNLIAWASVMMRRLRINEVRREAIVPHVAFDADRHEPVAPAVQAVAAELREALSLIDRLPADFRQALVLLRIEGEDSDAISARTGIPRNTIRSRAARAGHQLAAMAGVA